MSGVTVMTGNRGFTLFELMVTLAIAGIVAAFAVPGFQQLQVNSSVSALTGDLVQTINDSRSRAVSTRSRVFALQDLGSSAADVTTATAGDWSVGWRLTRGLALATSTPVARIERGNSRTPNTGRTAVNAFVYGNSTVDLATGTVNGGSKISAFGFNNFGRMIAANGNLLNSIVIVVCAPNVTNERGRVIEMSGMGRVTTTPVQNPATCS